MTLAEFNSLESGARVRDNAGRSGRVEWNLRRLFGFNSFNEVCVRWDDGSFQYIISALDRFFFVMEVP